MSQVTSSSIENLGAPESKKHPRLPRRSGYRFVAAAGIVLLAAGFLLSVGTSITNLGCALVLVATFLVVLTCLAPTFGLPYLLRPTTTVSLASAAGTFAGVRLYGDALQQFAVLRITESVGVTLGVIAGSVLTKRRIEIPRGSAQRRKAPNVVFWAGAASAMIFFAWRGIPILASNIESGRVDAASSGTGYFRLMAYMTVPAALAMFATRQRYARWYLLASFAIVIFLANRSPLTYLIVPLAFALVAKNGDLKRAGRLITVGALLAATVIVGVGTYRIVGQEDFKKYREYAVAIQNNDYLAIAGFSISNYIGVVVDNGILTKRLVDNGSIPYKFGGSYFTVVITALPGTQLSLDREIKSKSGSTFVGGGTPPTLAGEGYVNFGLLGTLTVPILILLLLYAWANQLRAHIESNRRSGRTHIATRVAAVRYGYLVVFSGGVQVAGISGASPFALSAFLVLIYLTQRNLGDEK